MLGPLASAHPALYDVSVRSLAGLGSGFLPTVGHPSAVAFASYFVDRSYPLGMLISLDSQFRTGDLHPISWQIDGVLLVVPARYTRLRRLS